MMLLVSRRAETDRSAHASLLNVRHSGGRRRLWQAELPCDRERHSPVRSLRSRGTFGEHVGQLRTSHRAASAERGTVMAPQKLSGNRGIAREPLAPP